MKVMTKSEAGRLGGLKVKKLYGSEYYQKIGKLGSKENCGRKSSLTIEEVKEIRKIYKRGMGNKLAKYYGVERYTISDLINRRTFKYI